LDLTIRSINIANNAGQVGFISSVALNFDPFDFLERKFFAGAIVEFSGTWRFVVRDGLSVLQRAPILQLNINPGGPKSVTGSGIR
jgi:hypothetical protein